MCTICPRIIVVTDLNSLTGRIIADDFIQDATGIEVAVGVIQDAGTGKVKLRNDNSYSAKDLSATRILVARELSLEERAFFHGFSRRHVIIGKYDRGIGQALLRVLATEGFAPSEAIKRRVEEADAVVQGRISGHAINGALKTFGRENSAWATAAGSLLSDDFSLSIRPISERGLSGRIDPGSINHGFVIFKGDSLSPPELGLLAHAVSHQAMAAEGNLDRDQIAEHLKKGRKANAVYGDIPDRGMILASRMSGNKLTFDLALPRGEAALADKVAGLIENMPAGLVTRHEACARRELKCSAQGDEADKARFERFFRAHAPMAARQVRAATLSLFLPFKIENGVNLPFGDPETWENDAAKDYFLPHLESLFGLAGVKGVKRCAHLESHRQSQSETGGDNTGPELVVNHPSYPGHDSDEPRLRRKVPEFRSHSLGGKVMLLEVPLDCAFGTGGAVQEIGDNFTLAELLDFTAFARRVRVQYESQARNENGEKTEVKWWFEKNDGRNLLTSLCKRAGMADNDTYCYLGDDRAFVMQSTILDGTPPEPSTGAAEELEIALERYNMVDGWADARFSSEKFARGEFTVSAYSRFAQTGSTLMCTEHSFSYLGFADRWVGDTQSPMSFAEEKIHRKHMPQIYRRMVVYALIVRNELNLFEQRLDKMAGDSGKALDDIRTLHKQFALFVNSTWRQTVSSQVQGQQLFALITRRFAITERIAKLTADFAALDRVEAQDRRAEAAAQEERAEAQRLAFVFLAGIAATVLTLFQVLGEKRAAYFPLPLQDWLSTKADKGLWWLWNYLGLLGVIAVASLLLLRVAKLWSWIGHRCRNHKNRMHQDN